VAVRQNSKSLLNSSGLRDVREERELLVRSLYLATSTASFTGTLVNSETTSKDMRISSSRIVLEWMKVENTTELRTLDSVLPIRGERM